MKKPINIKMLKPEFQFRENYKTIPDRALAAGIITQALLDYYRAKRLIKRKKITHKTFQKSRRMLSAKEAEALFAGKSAYEWLMFEPLAHQRANQFTLDDCLSVLEGVSRKMVRAAMKSSIAAENLPNSGRVTS